MSTLTGAAYQRPHFARANAQTIQPMGGPLKAVSRSLVPPMRHQVGRQSEPPIVLPKLHTPGRNLSEVRKTDMLSPARYHNGSQSVRNNRGPAAVYIEAKMMRSTYVPTLPPNHALKNYTALELSRFIDKRLTDVKKSHINYNRQGGDESLM